RFRIVTEAEKQRAVVLYTQHGLSIRGVADELGRSYGAVHDWLTDAQVVLPRGAATADARRDRQGRGPSDDARGEAPGHRRVRHRGREGVGGLARATPRRPDPGDSPDVGVRAARLRPHGGGARRSGE